MKGTPQGLYRSYTYMFRALQKLTFVESSFIYTAATRRILFLYCNVYCNDLLTVNTEYIQILYLRMSIIF